MPSPSVPSSVRAATPALRMTSGVPLQPAPSLQPASAALGRLPFSQSVAATASQVIGRAEQERRDAELARRVAAAPSFVRPSFGGDPAVAQRLAAMERACRPSASFPGLPCVPGGPEQPAQPARASCSSFLDEPEPEEDLIYIPCGIQGRAVEMMVDTGAQRSVISLPLARRLRLMGALDRSGAGVAAGVGRAAILGRLRSVPVAVGVDSGVEFSLDFSVLEVADELLLLGIDQLRRFRVVLDLERECLVFGGEGGVEVDFLPAAPSHAAHRAACPLM